jgi:hypothetical protein
MATRPGVLRRVASRTMAPGRRHVAKVLKGEDTVAKAAGGTVEDLLSGPKAKSPPRPGVKNSKASLKTATKKRAHPNIQRRERLGKSRPPRLHSDVL